MKHSTPQTSELIGHYDAKTIAEAGELLRAHGGQRAKVISGGVDLLRMLRQEYTPGLPGVLVNIKTIPDLSYIIEENDKLRIGALTCLSEVEHSGLIRSKYMILAETAGFVGTPQIRNMATIAGSLCQDLTCWYYRAGGNYYHCLRKGGKICFAKQGDHRWMFSIFGPAKGSGCYGTCQSDMAITLSALGTLVKTTKRTLPIEEFYTAIPGRTALSPDEIIEEVQIPRLSSHAKSKYLKFSIRNSIDHPLVSVASVVHGQEARIVIGGVYITPYRAHDAEESIRGRRINKGVAILAGEIASSNARPMSMNAWKVEVMKVLVERSLLSLSLGKVSEL
ncbi:MAG: hypothetical protein A2170_14080 [Deltaproteobacteria bacterium RBG_13_53_10]|nr:MAG: hypothetical protein A2170_14080 [Deltaproteobacteria bacterium RBG_13_53_10]